MKRLFLSILTIVCFLILTHNVRAQNGSIGSLEIIPTNPGVNSEIRLICGASFTSGGCNLTDHYVNIQGNNIGVFLNYTVGSYTVICEREDTITIGVLDAGNYQITANLIINLQQQIFDSDTINFEVNNTNNILEWTSENKIEISPNPFKNRIFINADSRIEKIQVISILGNIILQKEIKSDFSIDTSDLPNGIFIVVLYEDKGKLFTRKMIKNAL